MNTKNNNINKRIAIICGGSTTQKFLNQNSNVSLYINGFDNGKSTGLLRMLYPNTLGYSDFRKNASKIIEIEGNYQVSKLIEKRVHSEHLSRYKIELNEVSQALFGEIYSQEISLVCEDLMNIYGSTIALGNVVFAAAEIKLKSLTVSLSRFNKIHSIKMYSVSKDQNFYLYGLDKSGKLYMEQDMVAEVPHTEIVDIQFMRNQIGTKHIVALSSLQKLKIREKIVVLSPGTFFSSIYPSLPFLEIMEDAKVFFVPNHAPDWDNPHLSTDEMFEMCRNYLGNIEKITEEQFKSLVAR